MLNATTTGDKKMALKSNTKEIYDICVAKMIKAQQQDEVEAHAEMVKEIRSV
jgi:hypothetical protein